MFMCECVPCMRVYDKECVSVSVVRVCVPVCVHGERVCE